MTALLRKDAPWLLLIGIAGLVAMVMALPNGFADTFVVATSYGDLFQVAMGCGIVLGGVAASLDEMLGTREFALQRALSARTIAIAPLVGCGLVLAGWFVAVPVTGYLLFVSDRAWEPGHWHNVPVLWQAMVPACYGCALAFYAVSTPFRWWVRLAWFVALLLTTTSAMKWVLGDRDEIPTPIAAAGYAVLTTLAALGAIGIAGARRDADRPIGPRLRCALLVPLLVVATALWTGGCTQYAGSWLRQLHRLYPAALLTDGHIVLEATVAMPGHASAFRVVVVDADHRPTDTPPPPRGTRTVRHAPWLFGDSWFGWPNPKWEDTQRTSRAAGGDVWLQRHGRAWWAAPHDGRLRPIVKPDGSSFAPGARLSSSFSPDHAVIVEAGAQSVWTFDRHTGELRHVPLPSGDRVRGWQLAPSDVGEPTEQKRALIRGEHCFYALRHGRLEADAEPMPAAEGVSASVPAGILDPDPVHWTLVVDGDDVATPFRHNYTPRTTEERTAAAIALLPSLLRPPVVQLLSAAGPFDWAVVSLPVPRDLSVRENTPRAPSAWWLLDPLVASGRRPWLVLGSIVVAALCAVLGRARLRRIGADAATVRFWTVAIALLGPVALLIAVFVETRRAFADHRGQSVPAPRIVTLPAAGQLP